MPVKVRRERPDQRRHHRVTAPLYVEVAGVRARAADWSLGGLRVEEFAGPIPHIGALIPLSLTLPFQGFDVSFEAKAEVVRCKPAGGMFAVRFTELGSRERELMQHFVEELVRGSMVQVEDTIHRIDVPVTPASLEPDANPAAKLPVTRIPPKTMAMGSIYIALGIGVFAYSALLAYTNFFRLEVQTAVIAAPVETVTAQADGRIRVGSIAPGSRVRAGDVVVEVTDNQIERELEMAEIAVREQQAKLAFLKRRHADELERVQSFATVDMKNLQQTKIEMESLQAQLQAAQQHLNRITILHGKGFSTDARLDEAQKQVATLRKSVEGRKVELDSRVELAEHNYGKRLFTGDNVVGDMGQIEAQVKLAELEIGLARERKQAILNHKQRLAVRAPFDGTVLDVPRPNAAQVRRGDVLAVIEQRQRRSVAAFLTQDEVLRIGLGDEATVFVPALGETLQARVTHIDRTTGFIKQQEQRTNPGYTWRGPTDRSARVTLTFNDPRRVTNQDVYRSGLPVTVIFAQRSEPRLLDALRHLLPFGG